MTPQLLFLEVIWLICASFGHILGANETLVCFFKISNQNNCWKIVIHSKQT